MNLNYDFSSDRVQKHIRLTTFQSIILGFAGLILLGSLLLMLPVSTRSGESAPFMDCLFTAASATCVTGLVLHDTATYWSEFGQFLIMIMIQIGGMGVITLGALLTMAARKKIGLAQRSAMQEAIAAPQLGGIVRYTNFVIRGMLAIELIGALTLMPVMIPEFGVAKGLWYSLFHSISAFCNAGFDLMGVREPFSSLTAYSADAYMNIVIMLLIIIGGIGFLTWEDIYIHKLNFRKYRTQTKVVLLTTFLLLTLPALFFYFIEFADEKWGFSGGQRILASFFQSVTARTAGFNTADLSELSGPGMAVMIVLMFIGGSPGSTAGGIKTTTIAILVMSAIAVFRRREHTSCFGRRIEDDVVKNASAILIVYAFLFFTGAVAISVIDGLGLDVCLFEVASAIGTVGVTAGITTVLSPASRVILILLMYFGRVGGLTLIYATVAPARVRDYKYPKDKITVG